jgi:GDP-4-dehydro-6-deoxy-D-mannose reductase
MRKFLITGANGFVGRYLSRYITSKGDIVFSSGIELNSEIILDVCNTKQITKALKNTKPTNIIHLAGFSSVKKSFEDPELCMKINRDGTINLLESIRVNCPKSKIIIISSSEVYGQPKYIPIDEKHPLNGTNPYALSRIAQENAITKNFNDLNIIVSRSFNHTGPAQPKGFVLPDFASQIAEITKENLPVEIFVGNLATERDFTDVRDIVRAYYLLSTKDTPHKIYNVCSGKFVTISSILDLIIKLSNKKIKITIDNEKRRPIDIPRYFGSNRLIFKDVGWQPKIALEQTIKDTLEFWVKNNNLH